MSEITPTIITIVTSIVGLAMLAVIVSQRAQTPTVISSAGSALANVIAAAVSPLGGDGNGGMTNFSSAGNIPAGTSQ